MEFIQKVKINEWINSIHIYKNNQYLCIVTSHSVALHLRLNWPNHLCEIIAKENCPDKSTLYCSLIHGTEWEKTTFFGGTALGDLIIWRLFKTIPTILHRLSGHNVCVRN